jgi:hypothetical protein
MEAPACVARISTGKVAGVPVACARRKGDGERTDRDRDRRPTLRDRTIDAIR